jgi:hypothetical protein
MLEKLSAPYKWAPARISMDRIDAALAQGAQAEFLPGQGRRTPAMVTLKRPDGMIVDQWTVQSNDRHTAKFVASYNAKLRELRAAAPPSPTLATRRSRATRNSPRRAAMGSFRSGAYSTGRVADSSDAYSPGLVTLRSVSG